MKICFAASSGGHLEEISCLKKIETKYDSFLVTEKCDFSELKLGKRQYYLRQINRRERGFFFHFMTISFEALKILHAEKPDVIISTGALVTFPFCVIGKIIGKKVIYIESFARIDNPSLTGRLVYHFADLFLVQWEELLSYYPKATYIGGIF